VDPIRTLIVDDEPLARENLRIRLRGAPDFRVVGECGSGKEALEAIRRDHPDLVFLDIRLPDLDGFAVIERTSPEIMPVIVFVTAYDRHALDAFRVHALDYLLKPIEPDRFAETLETCRQRMAEVRRPAGPVPPVFDLAGSAPETARRRGSPTAEQPAACPERLVIRSGGRVLFVRCDAIDWIEATGDYIGLHVGEKTHLLHQTMNEMEARLDSRAFARVHRSAIVQVDRIRELRPLGRGEFAVCLAGGRELKLTRRHRERLEHLLGGRL
jgi:two-component system, LytTR family, response regulator